MVSAIVPQPQHRRPRIAVTLGDPAGVGPEITAKLLSSGQNFEKADVFVLADRSELQAGATTAGGIQVHVATVAGPHGAEIIHDDSALELHITQSEVSGPGGARSIYQLKRALRMAQAGEVDAIVFAPLNKSSLKQAGMTEEDELRWFSNQLSFDGATSEINIAGQLWTARVTSHIGIEEVAGRVTKASTLETIQLLHRLRWESGIDHPRLAVCALNPHSGENGSFGRQEIDEIRPAVLVARESGINVEGPFPCDTLFLKRAKYDGIVTMYHDQGQIALKLLAFDGGVTVEGGLPVPIATPAHGTAFDIAGKNLASVTSMQNAFNVALAMAERKSSRKFAELVKDTSAQQLDSSIDGGRKDCWWMGLKGEVSGEASQVSI